MPAEVWSTLSGGVLMILLAVAAWIQAQARRVDAEAKQHDDDHHDHEEGDPGDA